MAFSPLAPQANRSSPRTLPPPDAADGTPGVSPALAVPAGTQVLTVRLTSDAWPAGTGEYLEFGVDRSDDGGTTWRELMPPERRYEGSRAKDGSLPADAWWVGREVPPIGAACAVRARYCVPQGTLRFGLEVELL